ncbi:alpha/beta hydrolase family esterase [Corynebacterium halotolerans]|uniref:Phospholipase/carboxylesterase/thioesterase domain-containing protein n=1 Tax=Corynebacterium halotolerans YIM 70093 = DSM 44683 TaxID=1121362 RepID=M1P0V1_9CORY|nr:prolyl oligopeptidase family serine peptidase [Corynebacterium halotolerans]AGF73410.1 hypothetical protein A605_12070 [Corynebacterium halotolerans YIM 70093 = DSM 44683]
MSDVATYSAQKLTLEHQGRDRIFHVVAPTERPEHPALLFFFHGSLQSGRVARTFTGRSFDDIALRTGTILVYPDGVHHHFNDARRDLNERTRQLRVDDVGFTGKIIERMVADFHVDRSRVYVSGYSNGGQMVIRLLHDAPGLFAGAATFAATMPTPDNFAPGLPLRGTAPTPYLAIHGTEDTLVPYSGGDAGFDAARSRGAVTSAPESAAYFAGLNGLDEGDRTRTRFADDVVVDEWSREGHPPVQLWTVEGMGHVVPSPKEVDTRLGTGTDSFVAADVMAEFFGLG